MNLHSCDQRDPLPTPLSEKLSSSEQRLVDIVDAELAAHAKPAPVAKEAADVL